MFQLVLGPSNISLLFQVQIQGQQQGQMLGQVLQVPSGSHQQLQGVTTAQLIQPGELTEEQHQQVYMSTPPGHNSRCCHQSEFEFS